MEKIKLALTLLLAIEWRATCSFIELNDTTFATLPPLYGLDDWSQCQGPEDVYCMVDAALRADGPSDTLALLQAYSSQTLKHYNRTVVHRGVCVSRCKDGTANISDGSANRSDGSANRSDGSANNSDGSANRSDGSANNSDGTANASEWHDAAQQCVGESLNKYNLLADVLSVSWCSGRTRARGWGGAARSLAVCCVLLLAVTMAATAIHALGQRCANFQTNKYLLAFSLKQNWAILTYDRSNPRSDDRMKDVACLEGIRFLGMQFVIFSHVLVIFFYSYIDNPQYIERMYDQYVWQAVMNSPLWLQAFFSLSGFLTAYSVLLSSERTPLTILKCFNSIVNRYIRITPLAGFALWFTIAWFPLLGSGPQWEWLVGREAEDCSERWWYHMLYVHNHLPLGKLCMGQTWYLAVDMQLHIVGIFLLMLLVRYRKAALPVLGALIVASSVAAGTVTYWMQLQPIITAQSPESLRTLFFGSRVMSQLYLPLWMNAGGYAGGAAVAFLLYRNHERGVKLSQNKWFNILYHSSLTLGGAVVLTGPLFLGDAPPAAPWPPLYAALDRTLVALAFNVFMLGCVSRCHSLFRDLLSWRGFHPLGRLSYCAFLFHFIVLRLTLASNTQLGHATLFSLIALLVTASTLTYAVSVPLCLLIELPAIQLWKALTDSRPRVCDDGVTTKTLDLVARVESQRGS